METDPRNARHAEKGHQRRDQAHRRGRAPTAAGPTSPAAATKARSPSPRCRPCAPRKRGLPRAQGQRSKRRCNTSSTAGPPRGASSTRCAPAAGRGCRSRPPPSPRSTTPASSTPIWPTDCLKYVWDQFEPTQGQWSKGGGHDFYTHLYASQGSTWPATSTGTTTSPRPATSCSSMQQPRRLVERRRHRPGLRHPIALIILQLPYKYLPDFPALKRARGTPIVEHQRPHDDDCDLAETRRAAQGARRDPRADRPADRRPGRGRRAAADRLFARGHCILEGVPGLAKTLMVRTLAQSLSLDFNRIQFTPDLMPSDITGTEVLYEDRASGEREFRFVHGPSSPT